MLADASENRKVADVALAFGFDSAANFTRAFTQQFGYSPSSVRKASSRTDAVADSQQDQSQPVTFETLLRTLAMFDA